MVPPQPYMTVNKLKRESTHWWREEIKESLQARHCCVPDQPCTEPSSLLTKRDINFCFVPVTAIFSLSVSSGETES